MIERMTEKTRANLSKEGSVLKKIRIYGGIPMAIMAGGVAMLVCMVFLCGLLIIMGAPEAGYAFGILLGIPGLLMKRPVHGLLYNRALLCSTFGGRNKLCAEDTGFGCGILFR